MSGKESAVLSVDGHVMRCLCIGGRCTGTSQKRVRGRRIDPTGLLLGGGQRCSFCGEVMPLCDCQHGCCEAGETKKQK